MPITPQRRRAIEKLVHDFDFACRDLAFAGAKHPDERPEIEERHKQTRERLIAALFAADV